MKQSPESEKDHCKLYCHCVGPCVAVDPKVGVLPRKPAAGNQRTATAQRQTCGAAAKSEDPIGSVRLRPVRGGMSLPWLPLVSLLLWAAAAQAHGTTQTEAHDRRPPILLRHELPIRPAGTTSRTEGRVWSSSLDALWFPTDGHDRHVHALYLLQLPPVLFEQQSLADRSAFWQRVLQSTPIAAPSGSTDAEVLDYVPHHTVVVHCSDAVAAWAASSGVAVWVGRVPLHAKLNDALRIWLDKDGAGHTLPMSGA